MKYVRFSAYVFTAAALAALPSASAQDVQATIFPTPEIPGAAAYIKTAITGIEAGSSFVRFANLGDAAARNYVEIYGLTDKQTLGSFMVDVPAHAAIQVQPEQMIFTFAPVNWDQPVVLYVENGRGRQVWQHVKFNSRTGDFYDAGVCVAPPLLDYAAPGNAALDVFPGGLSRYSSTVTVHNFSDVAGRFEARVTDAATGKIAGTAAFDLGPRQSFSRTGAYFAQLAAPAGAAFDESRFLNVEFVPVGDANARIVVGHEVTDLSTGRAVNLSNPCPITGGMVTIQ